jgi:DNA-binding transcriptional regulator GbsR (MarR family)
MDAASSQFIEDCGLLMADAGLARSTGRVLGLLLICKPAHQSADSIREALQLSTGSVSAAVAMLRKMSLVITRTFPGDRRLYYLIDPEYEQKILDIRISQVQRGMRLAEAGLRLRPGDSRLLSLHHLYGEFEQLMRRIKPR